jgi:hypothetical protein
MPISSGKPRRDGLNDYEALGCVFLRYQFISYLIRLQCKIFLRALNIYINAPGERPLRGGQHVNVFERE